MLAKKQITLCVKREDVLHPQISGNKYRKLTYNLSEAKEKKHHTLLTFGGAYSNHIAATAYAGAEKGFKTIGVIRGEELVDSWQENPTLNVAHEHGMRFHFISRDAYRTKTTPVFLEKLKSEFGSFYMIPEGGTNPLAIKGCAEILNSEDASFDVICTSVGTGGTLAGLINSSHTEQYLIGFSALKGDFLKEDIRNFAAKTNWTLQTDYHFGGYAKVTEELVNFINDFKRQTQIPLDAMYTGKMMYGILDMIEKDSFKPNTKILAIHTGGLQGIAGMNLVLKKKNLPLLEL